MPTAADSPGPGGRVAPAAGLGQLGTEAERARTSYGEDALVMCDADFALTRLKPAFDLVE